MNNAELVTRAAEMLGAEAEQNPWFAKQGTLYSAIGYAMQELATKVAASDGLRHLLQTNYTLTVTNGEVNLYDSGSVPELATYSSPITAQVCHWVLVDSENKSYSYLAHWNDFLAPQPTMFGYFCLVGQRLKIKTMFDGSTTYNGTFTLTAPFVPAVAQVPAELDNDAVEALVYVIRTYPLPKEARAEN